MKVFDGYQLAAEEESRLTAQVARLAAANSKIKIAAILYQEDKTSQLYTRLKKEAAERVGMTYQVHEFSLSRSIDLVLAELEQLNRDQTVTGIIIQKPTRRLWEQYAGKSSTENDPTQAKKIDKEWRQAFQSWWQLQTSHIAINKDVDGLNPQTLAAIKNGTWQHQGRVLPATCRAVLRILQEAAPLTDKKVIILGKSDLLGWPLFYELSHRGINTELLASQDLAERAQSLQFLLDAQVIVSATGHHHLITGEMIPLGAVIIDVGEPKPDVDTASVQEKASFLTPVPGGVGPMTVVSLLANALDLVSQNL